jgi:hypothetical protein
LLAERGIERIVEVNSHPDSLLGSKCQLIDSSAAWNRPA